ncbi:MAG: ABC transporter ATP-binding protein [Methanomicrobiales archaeon]|nr:ABC transporter ATP-binding protein [Methanomicrobiales archaeon]
MPLIRMRDVRKVYPHPAGDVVALDGVTLEIGHGDFIAIMGPSGSGKSTLLNLIGCLDLPTSGEVSIEGRNVRDLSDDELTELRRDCIGFVFQTFNLLPLLNVVENVEFPCILKEGSRGCEERFLPVLKAIGIERDLFSHRPSELSGGQQQRVAIARALVNDPRLILCDEPTGNLDTKAGSQVMELLMDLNRRGRTVVVVTHDPRIAAYAKRKIEMMDGRIV